MGPREFVQYDDEELSTEGIKAACEKHLSPSLQRKGLSCDILAGEQWPSFYSMKHIPDLKVIHVRLIKSSSSSDRPDRPMKNDCVSSSSGQPCVSEPVTPPLPKRKYQTKRAHSADSTNAKLVFLKSLSISHVIKLG